MAKIFRIHAEDNVGVAVEPIAKGETVILAGESYTAASDIPAGHKMAIQDIRAGEKVIKYGFPIGTARMEESQQFRTAHIDGIYAYSHPHGCSQLGDDQLHTQKILAGLVQSPNAGAVLVLSLGCENNQVALMKEAIGDYDEDRVKFLVCQEVADEVAAGVSIMKELCRYADRFHRSEQPASKLVLGLKCGGSDGFSGITANPLVGMISNKIVAAGGTAILTEVPEMFNAGQLLEGRSMDEVSEEFMQYILDVASGRRQAKSEKLDKHELAIFKDGVTL